MTVGRVGLRLGVMAWSDGGGSGGVGTGADDGDGGVVGCGLGLEMRGSSPMDCFSGCGRPAWARII